ncbi:RNA polymerase II C-terminal domain phosphatase-like 4, partial [Mucuna pruriens]
MDDFTVYADSFEACLSNLSKVLQRCIDTNLVLNFEKCHFMVTEGIILGHLVSNRGIEVDKAKIDIITSLPNLTSVREVRSFLGHTSFYRRFIKNFSKLALLEVRLFCEGFSVMFGFNCKSLLELKNDEDEPDGALSKILKVLKQVHCRFFDVLSSVRSEVLSGCVIVFSRIFYGALPSLQKMAAEQMGATCLTEIDQSVTHVVATDAETEKSSRAVKEQKFLVHPDG